VTPHNPHFIRKTIKVKTKHVYSILARGGKKQMVKPQIYLAIREEYYEYTGRINLAYIKTDSATKAIINYLWEKGEKTKVRLIFGYSFSEKTQVSGEIYSYYHSSSYELEEPATAGRSSEAYVSIVGTLRVEIWAYYWEDDRGVREEPEYYEVRLWMYNLDGNTLSNEKGDDPYWGAFSRTLIRRGIGKGFEVEDAAFSVWHYTLYINYDRTEIPISEIVYQWLLDVKVDPEYEWLEPLLPLFKVVIDHVEWEVSGVCFTIWGAEGYDIAAQARYVDAHGICLMAIDLASQPPEPWPIF